MRGSFLHTPTKAHNTLALLCLRLQRASPANRHYEANVCTADLCLFAFSFSVCPPGSRHCLAHAERGSRLGPFQLLVVCFCPCSLFFQANIFSTNGQSDRTSSLPSLLPLPPAAPGRGSYLRAPWLQFFLFPLHPSIFF